MKGRGAFALLDVWLLPLLLRFCVLTKALLPPGPRLLGVSSTMAGIRRRTGQGIDKDNEDHNNRHGVGNRANTQSSSLQGYYVQYSAELLEECATGPGRALDISRRYVFPLCFLRVNITTLAATNESLASWPWTAGQLWQASRCFCSL